MANYTASTSVHKTATASEADLVTLTGTASSVTVYLHPAHKDTELYFTVGDNPTTATLLGNNTYIAFAGQPSTVKFDGTNVKVSLISDEAVTYSVIANQGF